jgi:hypothetical protein
MTVAQTILQQLGGNKFRVMTGAKNFMEDGDSLIFWIPTKNGIDNVIITLEFTDTYRMTFQKWNRKTLQQKIVYTVGGVYADQLQSIFTNQTGLDTHL